MNSPTHQLAHSPTLLILSFASAETESRPGLTGCGEQHDEPIDADTLAARRRQAVLERADVVLVHRVRLEIAARAVGELRLEAPALLGRIVSSLKALATSKPPM